MRNYSLLYHAGTQLETKAELLMASNDSKFLHLWVTPLWNRTLGYVIMWQWNQFKAAVDVFWVEVYLELEQLGSFQCARKIHLLDLISEFIFWSLEKRTKVTVEVTDAGWKHADRSAPVAENQDFVTCLMNWTRQSTPRMPCGALTWLVSMRFYRWAICEWWPLNVLDHFTLHPRIIAFILDSCSHLIKATNLSEDTKYFKPKFILRAVLLKSIRNILDDG